MIRDIRHRIEQEMRGVIERGVAAGTTFGLISSNLQLATVETLQRCTDGQ